MGEWYTEQSVIDMVNAPFAVRKDLRGGWFAVVYVALESERAQYERRTCKPDGKRWLVDAHIFSNEGMPPTMRWHVERWFKPDDYDGAYAFALKLTKHIDDSTQEDLSDQADQFGHKNKFVRFSTMSIQDRIAKRLMVAHGRVLDKKGNTGWWTDAKKSAEDADRKVIESQSLVIKFGKKAKLTCELAGDDDSQVVGLQKYASLPDGYGMVFPYDPPKKVSFHMGTVPFPIDIMFVGADNRISRIVKYAEPGTRETWGMTRVAYVIEANGGFCDKNKVELGDEVTVGTPKKAQATPMVCGVCGGQDDKLFKRYGPMVAHPDQQAAAEGIVVHEYCAYPDRAPRVKPGEPGSVDNKFPQMSESEKSLHDVITHPNLLSERIADYKWENTEINIDSDYPVNAHKIIEPPKWSSRVLYIRAMMLTNSAFIRDTGGRGNGGDTGGYVADVEVFIGTHAKPMGTMIWHTEKRFKRDNFDGAVNHIQRAMAYLDTKTVGELTPNRFVNKHPSGMVKFSQEQFDPSRSDSHTRTPKIAPDPTNRFKDRDLVDVQTDGQDFDPAHFEMTLGYDPTGEGGPGDPTRSSP